MEFPPCHTRFWLCYPFRSKGRADLYVPIDKRSITSGSDYVRQLLDGYFLTLVPGNEFYLATPFFIGDGITVALSQINGHKIIFYVLMIGYLNHIVNVFVCNPDMPGPEDGITHILDRNDGIALPDGRTVHFERDIAAIGIGIVFYIRNQVHRILPDQFGLGRRTSITADVWIRDPVPGMVDERIQDIGSCHRGGIRGSFVAEFLIALPYTSGKE